MFIGDLVRRLSRPGENDLEGSWLAGGGGTECPDTREVRNTQTARGWSLSCRGWVVIWFLRELGLKEKQLFDFLFGFDKKYS